MSSSDYPYDCSQPSQLKDPPFASWDNETVRSFFIELYKEQCAFRERCGQQIPPEEKAAIVMAVDDFMARVREESPQSRLHSLNVKYRGYQLYYQGLVQQVNEYLQFKEQLRAQGLDQAQYQEQIKFAILRLAVSEPELALAFAVAEDLVEQVIVAAMASVYASDATSVSADTAAARSDVPYEHVHLASDDLLKKKAEEEHEAMMARWRQQQEQERQQQQRSQAHPEAQTLASESTVSSASTDSSVSTEGSESTYGSSSSVSLPPTSLSVTISAAFDGPATVSIAGIPPKDERAQASPKKDPDWGSLSTEEYITELSSYLNSDDYVHEDDDGPVRLAPLYPEPSPSVDLTQAGASLKPLEEYSLALKQEQERQHLLALQSLKEITFRSRLHMKPYLAAAVVQRLTQAEQWARDHFVPRGIDVLELPELAWQRAPSDEPEQPLTYEQRADQAHQQSLEPILQRRKLYMDQAAHDDPTYMSYEQRKVIAQAKQEGKTSLWRQLCPPQNTGYEELMDFLQIHGLLIELRSKAARPKTYAFKSFAELKLYEQDGFNTDPKGSCLLPVPEPWPHISPQYRELLEKLTLLRYKIYCCETMLLYWEQQIKERPPHSFYYVCAQHPLLRFMDNLEDTPVYKVALDGPEDLPLPFYEALRKVCWKLVLGPQHQDWPVSRMFEPTGVSVDMDDDWPMFLPPPLPESEPASEHAAASAHASASAGERHAPDETTQSAQEKAKKQEGSESKGESKGSQESYHVGNSSDEQDASSNPHDRGATEHNGRHKKQQPSVAEDDNAAMSLLVGLESFDPELAKDIEQFEQQEHSHSRGHIKSQTKTGQPDSSQTKAKGKGKKQHRAQDQQG